MTDNMRPLPFAALLDWALGEYRHAKSIFGIPRQLFYRPRPDAPHAVAGLFAAGDSPGRYLATPIGPGAGPHTQLAQNIVSAWLCGGRFIELKTVQIMDDLNIPRPCIDMADEGYNVEWSQELRLEESLREYVKAWVLVHLLHRHLGWDQIGPLGTVFNMSVGYDLKGVQSEPMVRFMDGLADASGLAGEYLSVAESRGFRDLAVPACISDNVTLSTMHGCPPDEIEAIARHLLVDRGLHTTVKLNPTLLGRERVLEILHGRLGFRGIDIPTGVFDHDLQYPRAVRLIRALSAVAADRGLCLGVKLSNTLAMSNHRGVLPGSEMYMSGRALYPVTMALFHRLATELGPALSVSFSAGADALNLPAILAAGARPVTVVSDLLKPGGYGRFGQHLADLESEMARRGASSLEDLAGDRERSLAAEAAACLVDPRYHKAHHIGVLPKVASGLNLFDCVAAPCVEQCAIAQDVPAYAWHIARGHPDAALRTILARSPLPACTGYVCTHLCETRCTQHDYEGPVAIRALKRFAAMEGRLDLPVPPSLRAGAPVAVVGSGPSGLSAATVLALNGVPVTVYESAPQLGGLLAGAIPPFRLPAAALEDDLERIRALGVRFKVNTPAPEAAALLAQGFAAVYLAAGAPVNIPLGIPGEDGPSVYDAVSLLHSIRRQVEDGEAPRSIGRRVLVVGGGNSAIDAARAALRLGAEKVTLVYRRTRHEMPAIGEEVEAALREGVALAELTLPVRVVRSGRKVLALECRRAVLGEPGRDGRPQPVPVEGSDFGMAADAIVVAVGQRPAVAVNAARPGGPTTHPGVYAGGDAVRGPSTVIQAIADGRAAAEAICRELGLEPEPSTLPAPALSDPDIARVKAARARREPRFAPPEAGAPLTFEPLEPPLGRRAARREAARCLQCASLCDKCVEVCPNRANLTYLIAPVELPVPVLSLDNGEPRQAATLPFRVSQARQIVHIQDLCNACGNCETFCVHQGRPFRDKPRLFLDRARFAAAEDTAFLMTRGKDGWVLHRRGPEGQATLRLSQGFAVYEDDDVKVMVTPNWQVEEMVLKQPFSGEKALTVAAEMHVLASGLAGSLPFLPYPDELDGA